jgi:hypothetical protein
MGVSIGCSAGAISADRSGISSDRCKNTGKSGVLRRPTIRFGDRKLL